MDGNKILDITIDEEETAKVKQRIAEKPERSRQRKRHED